MIKLAEIDFASTAFGRRDNFFSAERARFIGGMMIVNNDIKALLGRSNNRMADAPCGGQ